MNSLHGENGMGNGQNERIAGIETQDGRYYLLTVGAPQDTRSGHEHRRGHERVECDIHTYRAALDTAYQGGATLYRYSLGDRHARIYFQRRFVDMDEVKDALVERLQLDTALTPPWIRQDGPATYSSPRKGGVMEVRNVR